MYISHKKTGAPLPFFYKKFCLSPVGYFTELFLLFFHFFQAVDGKFCVNRRPVRKYIFVHVKGRVMMNAGIDLLPEWAQEMLGLSLTPLQRRTTRLMVHGVARVLRASVRNGAWHCAMRRMAEA